MPGAHVVRRDRRQRFRKPAHGQTVASLAERRRERELERIAKHVVGHPLGFRGHEPTLGRDVRVPQVGVQEDGVQQSGRLAEVLHEHGGAEAERVSEGAGGQRAAQALERECECGRVEIAGAPHRRTHQQGPEPRLARRVEPAAGDMEPEGDERHPRLPVDQQVGTWQSGDADTVLRLRASGDSRPGVHARRADVLRRPELGDGEGRSERIRRQVSFGTRREVGHAGHRVRREMPSGHLPHLRHVDLGKTGVLPVQQADVLQRLRTGDAHWPGPPWTRVGAPSGRAPGCGRAPDRPPSARVSVRRAIVSAMPATAASSLSGRSSPLMENTPSSVGA